MTLRRFTLVIACLLLLGCGAWAAAALYFDGPLHPWNALLSCLYLITCAGAAPDFAEMIRSPRPIAPEQSGVSATPR